MKGALEKREMRHWESRRVCSLSFTYCVTGEMYNMPPTLPISLSLCLSQTSPLCTHARASRTFTLLIRPFVWHRSCKLDDDNRANSRRVPWCCFCAPELHLLLLGEPIFRWAMPSSHYTVVLSHYTAMSPHYSAKPSHYTTKPSFPGCTSR